jgi:hypothetical protein
MFLKAARAFRSHQSIISTIFLGLKKTEWEKGEMGDGNEADEGCEIQSMLRQYG